MVKIQSTLLASFLFSATACLNLFYPCDFVWSASDSDNVTNPVFSDITKDSGVAIFPTVKDQPRAQRFALSGGSMSRQRYACIALEDLDKDGHLDLIVCAKGFLHLFRGTGTGRFLPPKEGPHLALNSPRYAASGIAIGDINNDGLPDMYVGVINGPNHLFLNQGRLTFLEVAKESGTDNLGRTSSVNLVDYNNDGHLDIYACNVGRFLKDRFNINLQLPGKPQTSESSYAREQNALYRNNGDGTFTDVTIEAGLGSADLSWASAFADYDDDGDQDLFIANDFGLNRFYRNNGNATFTELTGEIVPLDPGAGMSVMWGDIDNNGRMDLLIGNMYSHTAHRLMKANHASFSSLPPAIQTIYDLFVSGNFLLMQQSDGTFLNEAAKRGVGDASWAWGSILADLNNDGWLDIYVVNGWTRGEEKTDYCMTVLGGVMEGFHQAQELWEEENLPKTMESFSAQNPIISEELLNQSKNLVQAFTASENSRGLNPESLLPFLDSQGNIDIDTSFVPRIGDLSWDGYNINSLFMNPGNNHEPFQRIQHSPLNMDDIGKTVAAGDIDGDGDLDLVVVSATTAVKIFRNDSKPRHWLVVALEGTQSNRSAIGARVRLKAGDLIQTREVASGVAFCSHHSLELEFGLGDASEAEWLEVHWPSGLVQRFDQPPTDTRITLREPQENEQQKPKAPAGSNHSSELLDTERIDGKLLAGQDR